MTKSNYGLNFLAGLCLAIQCGCWLPGGSARASSSPVQYLTNDWMLARTPDVAQTGSQISQVSFNPTNWVPAVVPGTALTSYQNAGLISDPYFGTNMEVDETLDGVAGVDGSGYYDTNYWYRDTFYVSSGDAGQKIWLNFDGINWEADIYVNGTLVGGIDCPFIRGKFDVTSLITPGATNCVAVKLIWCDATVSESPTFICADSWDFMPAIAGREVGLYQNVYLSTAGSVQIVDPYVITTLPLPNTSPATLTLQVGLTNTTASSVSGTLLGSISPDGIAFQTNITVKANAFKTVNLAPGTLPQLSVTNPALWWPNGYGPQNLHNLQLTFQVAGSNSDVQAVSFGIRQYSYNTNGVQLQVSCNGQKILCKGGNWGIADAMLKYTPGQLDTAIQLHQQMNFDMIRCWHGNCDLPAFYDACDKYGIMVWDEFWLNGSNDGLWPMTDIFETNSVDKIKRLRNRACLAVWCGENEASPPGSINTFLTTNISILDGTRIYIPASNADPVHGGGPYAVEDPYWYYTVQGSRGFTTEIGLPSFPPVESMEAMMPNASLWPVGDQNWLYHGWATDEGNKGEGQYTSSVNNFYGATTGIAGMCQEAQMLNLETYKVIFESWNAKLWNDGSGVLLWMSQPAWPSMIWQTYDWYFETGGSYFGSKKACEPIHIQWSHYDGGVRVVNTTPQPLTNLTATIQVYNLDGTLKYTTNVTGINVLADCVTNCAGLFYGTNIALGTAATSSANYNSNWPASYAVDGIYGNCVNATRWNSPYSDPQWMYVDLGSTQSIDTVILLWEGAYAKAYQIQVSNDASTWTTVWSTNAMTVTTVGDMAYVTSSFSPTNARYVRMYGTKRGTGYGYSIWEFQVYNSGVQNNGISGLSSVHFIKLKLTDSNSNLLSDNFYWRGTTPCNYTSLGSLATANLGGYSTAVTDGTNTVVTAVLTNNSSGIAYANRLKLMHSATQARVLPTIYSDNYFSLLPHEAKTVTFQFANTNFTVFGDYPQLTIQGWNTSSNQVPSGPGINLALNQPVTVSSSTNGNGGANAVDGDYTTRWLSDWSDPQWIEVDLGTTQSVSSVVLYWHTSYAKAYQIETSTDNTSWTTVYSESNGVGGVEYDTFSPVSARYVRMYGTQRGTSFGYSLWEYQVFGPANLALNKKVAVSSVDNVSDLGPYAVDGNASTRWSSAYSDPQWISVDLGLVVNINQVVLNWQAAYGKGYQIQVSTDNINWTTVFTETNGAGGIETDNFSTVPARYVRMYGTSRGTIWGYSLWEFEVYGSNGNFNPLALKSPLVIQSMPQYVQNLSAQPISNSNSQSVRISWDAISQQTYSIQYSSNLVDWLAYPTQVTPADTNATADLPVDGQAQMFYRVAPVF